MPRVTKATGSCLNYSVKVTCHVNMHIVNKIVQLKSFNNNNNNNNNNMCFTYVTAVLERTELVH